MSAVANLHMKIQGSKSGEIKGESRVTGFSGWIELDDWGWKLSLEAPPAGKGSRKEESVPSVLSFGKLMDCSTTGMLSAMNNGELLTVTLSMREASDDPFSLDILLEDARLTEYGSSFKSEEKYSLIDESWVLDYRKVTLEYRVGARNLSKVLLTRPAWASTSKPKGQGPDDEVIKLTEDLSPGALEALWVRVKAAADEKKKGAPKKKGDGG